MAGLAQAPSTPVGAVPYVFELNNPEETVHALVKPEDLSKSRIPVTIEEPWNRILIPRLILKHKLKIDPYPEELHTYRLRMKNAWKSNGGMQLGNAPNSPWVLKDEYELMQRASAMSQPPIVEVKPEPAPEVRPQKPQVTIETVEVDFMAQWGLHVFIGIVTLVLIGFVIRWGFFSQVWLGVGL